jgi:hypothetical protein
MPDAAYLREQAQRCFRLAREIMDTDVRAKLEELGREFEEKAKELDGGAFILFPHHPFKSL